MSHDEPLAVGAAFMAQALDSITAHIAILDGDGVILYVNEAWKRFARNNGLNDRHYAVGTSYLATCDCSIGEDSEEAPLVSSSIRKVIDGTLPEFRIEYPCHAPDRKRWFQMRVTRFPSGEGPRLVVVHEDVTEIKLVQEALRLTECSVESASLATFWTDRAGVLARVNRAATELLQTGRAQLLRQSMQELLPAVREQDVLARLERKGSVGFEAALRLGDGGELPVEVNVDRVEFDGEPLLLWFVLPVAERRQAEAALRESETRLREITDTIGEGLYVVDAAGRITFVNPEARRLLGWTEEELVGAEAHAIFHHTDRNGQPFAPGDCAVSRALEGGSTVRGEEQFFRRDGSELPVLVSAAPIARDGRIAGSVVAFHDISDLVAARQKDRMLIQQSRLAAMGEMIGNIAHQWRQPLNALGLVLGFLQEAHRLGRLDGAAIEQAVADGRSLIQRMSATIDDFRNFFKPNRHAVRFDLGDVLRDTLHLLDASLHNNGIRVTVEEWGEPVETVGFPNEYSQVLLNILGNAKEAVMGRRPEQRRIELRTARDGEEAVLTVCDHGGGIDAAIAEKVFEPYFTTKESGTGIGLYMSKMIIEQNMKGTIRFRNTGDGAAFEVRTPVPGERRGD